jgi:hypothetical protein
MNTKATLVAAAALFAATGCSHEYDLEFDIASNPPGYADLTSHSIRIEEGLAVAATVVPLEDDDVMDKDTEITMESFDSRVLEVGHAEVDRDYKDLSDDWTFVLLAQREGSTTLRVTFDRDIDIEIPVVVERQDL